MSPQVHTEWLEANGLGGWASGTVSGIHTRRYHGLLVAALRPPVGRSVLISRLDETLVLAGNNYDLSANQFPGTFHPNGYQFIESFEHDLFPTWTYRAGEVYIRKTIAAIHGENTTVVSVHILKSPERFSLFLRPFYACRDYHSLQHAFEGIRKDGRFQDGVFQYHPVEFQPDTYISVPNSDFHPDFHWYYNFEYAVELERGLDYREDLFTPGVFEIRAAEGDSIHILLSTEEPSGRSARVLMNRETTRRQQLAKAVNPGDADVRRLTLAADQFIVKRGNNLRTILAGYHWFTDWGRDTMIALPGLTLTTRRFNDAKLILKEFSLLVDRGMVPNRFPDEGEAPEYNTVDATLWFFLAADAYARISKDSRFVLDELLPVFSEIIAWHERGTRYRIQVDADGLLRAGEPGVQLTWMDARVGDWVVTPRMGKPVEINALWYNALMIYGQWLEDADRPNDAKTTFDKAARVRKTFEEQFWNAEQNCLYDVIDGSTKDGSVRPNQIFALSLPHPLISDERARAVLQTVTNHLYTPVGLRSLSPFDPRYVARYEGDPRARDAAYHQGTVWAWLLGPYVDAVRRYGESDRLAAIQSHMRPHLQEACVGSVSEIFDGEAPHSPRGCISQAWSVAEWLRVFTS